MIRVKAGSPVSRSDLAVALDEAKIGNRMLFGGNLVRQPVFAQARTHNAFPMRVVGDLAGADAVMKQTLFVGTYPGIREDMCGFIAGTIAGLYQREASATRAL
jgi:CDP-6-deoxy-D-xylo-4-hexulose-3-dehydrase